MCFYATIRGILVHPDAFRGFVSAPALWLDSIVLPDPLGVLPVVSALSVLANVEINGPKTSGEGAEIENNLYMKLVIRGASLTFVPITACLPSGLLVFMATNAAYTAIIMCAFRRYWWVRPKIEQHWLMPNKVGK